MPYAQFQRALTAIREALDSGGGSLRTVPTSRFTDDLHNNLSNEEQRRRGIRSDKPFRVDIVLMEPHEASPPITGDLVLYQVDFEIVVSRTVSVGEQVDADTMSTLRALAFEDADVIRQSLGTPPNLAQTSAALATDIAGGHLTYVNSRARVIGNASGTAQHLETIHRFTGVLKSRPSDS